MVKRTAFTQLGRSYAMTVFAALGIAVLYLAPPALTVAGGTWALMSAFYHPTLRAYGRPARDAGTLPLAAALYVAMTVDSALATRAVAADAGRAASIERKQS